MFNKKIVLAAAALLLAGASQAQVAVTADVGTTGVGAHLIVPMEKTLNGRFGVNFFNYSHDEKAGSAKYDMKTELRTFDILFDWYVFSGTPMYVTAGVVYNGNKISGRGVSNNGTFTLNGHVYNEADVGSLQGKIEYRKAAPYLGIGWGNPLVGNKNWTITGDAGVIYQGKPQSHLVSLGCLTSAVVCTTLAKDVAAERPLFQGDIDSYKVYPVLRVGASYRF